MSKSSDQALTEIYDQNRSRLKRFLAARLGDEDEAEDAVQEVFLKLHQAQPNQPIENPAAYLFRIAANTSIDFLRRRQSARIRDSQWADLQASRAAGEPISPHPSPERVAESRARLERLVAALEDLSPKVRRVFILHKFEGLSHAEVAAELGISKSTVEKHMIAALKSLIHLRGDD